MFHGCGSFCPSKSLGGKCPFSATTQLGKVLPIRAEFPLGRVPNGAYDLSKSKVSNLKVSVTDPRVVVFGHAVLVPSEPLLCCRPELVH